MSAPHPIHLADPHQGVLPHAYIVWKKCQRCKHCGAQHCWSETYAKTHLRSQFATTKYITNMRPVESPQLNLPIEIRESPETLIPFCHECASRVSLAHLPKPDQDLQKPDWTKRDPEPPRQRQRKDSPKPITLDDLL